MKKNGWVVALAITLMIALAACGAAPAAAPTGPLADADLAFPVEGKTFALKTDAAPLLAALGDGYELSSAISCLYEGEDKTFDYGGIIIYTYPQGETDIIDEIIVSQAGYPTARGIAVGAAREEVVAAYGEDFVDEGGVLTYTLGSHDDLAAPRLLFEIADGKVASIDYYNPSNIVE